MVTAFGREDVMRLSEQGIGEADIAGLAPHDSILAVDGMPIMDETGFHREYLRGPEGSPVVGVHVHRHVGGGVAERIEDQLLI